MPPYLEGFNLLFSSSPFIPHGHCYLWKPGLVGLHVLSDSLTALAYYSIPVSLLALVRQRKDLPFNWIFLLFGAFIIACGTTHLLEVWTLWHPIYWISGVVKAITAVVSLATAIVLVPLLPKALALPSPALLEATNRELEREIGERRKSEARYRAIVEDQTELIARFQADGTLLFLNEAYCRYFGLNLKDLIGKKYEPVVYDADREKVAQLIASLSAENPVVTIENRVLVAGEVRWTQWRIRRLADETGQFLEFQAVGRDITALKQTEEQLCNFSNRLTLALKSGAIGTWESDLRHHLNWDDGMYAIYGFHPPGRPVTYQDWVDTIHPDDRTAIESALQNAIQGKKDFDAEFRIIRPDSTLRFIKASAIFQPNEQGEPQRLVGINYDITVRKQSEATLTHYTQEIEDLYNNAPCGYHSLDGDGRFVRVNETELQWLGYTRDAMIGRLFIEFLTEESQQTFRQNYPSFCQRGWVKDLEFEMVCKDGSILPVLINATAVTDEAGNYLYSRSTLLDIRDRKQVEHQLRQTNTELARATRLKDEFLANMSHELRTPLTSILGMADILQEEVHGTLNEEQQESVAIISQSGKHLLSLINDILDLAKIEAGKLELQLKPTSIQELCDSSLCFVRQIAYDKSIRLTAAISPQVSEIYVDELRMRQALINLLSNAVKFTPEGGQITLTVNPNYTQQTIQFSVIDTGIGITPADMSKLFQAFIQIDSKLNRQYDGTGLGLALLKRIVELHQGKVEVESTPEKGSCFTIILPSTAAVTVEQAQTVYSEIEPSEIEPSEIEPSEIEPSEIEPSQGNPENPALPSRSTPHFSPPPPPFLVLLAEDNPANIETFSYYLISHHYQVLIATNGREVVSLAREHQPDIILMDIQMPELDGLEATRQIRNILALANTPIIALTALAMAGDRERCLAAGATAYLTKPVRLKHLLATIQELCNHKKE